MDLADKIIDIANNGSKEYSEYGIDELGLPVPYPLNCDYIVARIMARSDSFFRIGNDAFVNRTLVKNNASSISIYCGEIKIALWKNDALKDKWKGATTFINRECHMIYSRILELFPEYDRRYIEVVDNLIWDREKTDFIIKGD